MPYGWTHWQTLKDRATQLLIKYKSGTLVTQSMQNLSFEVLSALSQHWRESPLVPDGESKKHLDFDLGSLVVISLSFSPMLVLLCRARWCNPKLEQDPLASPAQKYWPWQEKNIWGEDHFLHEWFLVPLTFMSQWVKTWYMSWKSENGPQCLGGTFATQIIIVRSVWLKLAISGC